MQDEVDRLVAAWRRERPDIDVRPLEVLSRVTRLARHLDRARRAAFSEHELETWEFDVLSALRRSGIDRLTDKGLVQRAPDPTDRRGVLVSLTDRGLHEVDAALSDLLAHEQKLLAGLTERQREILAGLLRDLVAPFDNPA
jgi:hypothetical protein